MNYSHGKLLVLALASLACIEGCSRDDSHGLSQSMAASATEGSNAPGTWVGAVALTTGRGANSTPLPNGAAVGSDKSLWIQADVSDAPPNATLRVTWKDTQGTVLGEQTRILQAGERTASFAAPANIKSTPGRYQAVIGVDGQSVRTIDFRIVKP